MRREWDICAAMLWMGVLTVMLCCGISFLNPSYAFAAKKGKISCTVKGDTLTVDGTGVLKKIHLAKISKKEIKKVKKIVVNKGVTSIPEYAFYKFKYVKEVEIASTVKRIWEEALPKTEALERVTIPGTFELATENREVWKDDNKVKDGAWYGFKWGELQQSLNNGRKIDTICFNSPLSLKTVSWVRSKNLVVSESDPGYKSVDGVIYSKDGKSIVRVPAERESLSVMEGCEEFCLHAVLYAEQNGNDSMERTKATCSKLNRIVLPESVKRVEKKKYAAFRMGKIPLKELEIKTEQLDSESVLALVEAFQNIEEQSIFSQMDSISFEDGMYINTNDNGMMRYKGNASEITIPDGMKKIGAKAFYKSKVKKIMLPDTVTQIGRFAFEECRQLTELRLSKSITTIPNGAFAFCERLNRLVIPDGVTVIEDEAFYGTRWKEIILPAHVTSIGHTALGSKLKNVTFCGRTAGFDVNTFSECESAVLHFRTGVEAWKTWIQVTGLGAEMPCRRIWFEWGKIAGVDGWQIQVSDSRSFRKKTQTYEAGKGKTKMFIKNRKINLRYVRIRPYKRKAGKRMYGKWSVAKP